MRNLDDVVGVLLDMSWAIKEIKGDTNNKDVFKKNEVTGAGNRFWKISAPSCLIR